jgi:hypothetical protein
MLLSRIERMMSFMFATSHSAGYLKRQKAVSKLARVDVRLESGSVDVGEEEIEEGVWWIGSMNRDSV